MHELPYEIEHGFTTSGGRWLRLQQCELLPVPPQWRGRL